MNALLLRLFVHNSFSRLWASGDVPPPTSHGNAVPWAAFLNRIQDRASPAPPHVRTTAKHVHLTHRGKCCYIPNDSLSSTPWGVPEPALHLDVCQPYRHCHCISQVGRTHTMYCWVIPENSFQPCEVRGSSLL